MSRLCRFCGSPVMNRILQVNTRSTTLSVLRLSSSKSTKKEDEQDDGPIKFSSSPAAARSWNVRQRYIGRRDTTAVPWIESYSVLFSLSIFLIYFCVLREENDVDEELKMSLYDRLPGLEKKQLQISLEYNQEHNLDTTDIVRRLQEIEVEEQQQHSPTEK